MFRPRKSAGGRETALADFIQAGGNHHRSFHKPHFRGTNRSSVFRRFVNTTPSGRINPAAISFHRRAFSRPGGSHQLYFRFARDLQIGRAPQDRIGRHHMPLTPGMRLGPYEIVALLGAGGMGAVYRAIDTKLNREVAIKVLPEALANDPDYLARFTREAQVLASLNHPNIAIIHGVEEQALVMELVRGQTLEERIAAGPIPLEEALDIARQIALALEAAHEKGVIHRDLKPANVKVTPEGVVKVLDFGLAKTADPVSSVPAANSPTLTIRATQAGLIMGTAGYMAPEQAAGKVVDKRSDIWSFGVVLYEMLTGASLFAGETISHTLADVLRAPIDLHQLPQQIPGAVRDLLRRCLNRDVRKRLRDMGDACIAIEEVLSGPQSGPDRSAAIVPSPSPFGRITAALAAILALALVALAFVHFRELPAPAHLMRFQMGLRPTPQST